MEPDINETLEWLATVSYDNCGDDVRRLYETAKQLERELKRAPAQALVRAVLPSLAPDVADALSKLVEATVKDGFDVSSVVGRYGGSIECSSRWVASTTHFSDVSDRFMAIHTGPALLPAINAATARMTGGAK